MTSAFEVTAHKKRVMPDVVVAKPPLKLDPPSVSASGSRVALIVVLILVGVFAVYWRTTLSMVAIWERSDTFAHGFVVVPIFCYLLWRRRDTLAMLEPTPCWGALLGVAAAGFVWLIGELVSAASISQFAMVAMVAFAVWTVLGTRIAMALSIPLAFLFFAVPIGEFLVPTLIDWTADFTVAALRASGVPVYREGNYFVIPSGAWSVVEACSGLRYLIASLMVGSLYAYLSYRSPIRRATFIVASLLVPIVANWFRAYMIVMIGHLSSNRLAVGVDHLIYGWIFFGLVMGLLLWVGSRWREDEPGHSVDQAIFEAPAIQAHRQAASAGRILVAVIGVFIAIVMWQPVFAYFDHSGASRAVRFVPVEGRNGWMPTPGQVSAWRPDLSGSRAELSQTFAKDEQRVGLDIAFYRGQTRDAKAISSTNQLVSATNRVWKQIEAGTASIDANASSVHARTRVIARQGERLAVWQWYWVDGHVTSSDYAAKFYQAVSVLRGHGDSIAWVIIFTPTEAGESQVHSILQSFAAGMQAPINTMLSQAVLE